MAGGKVEFRGKAVTIVCTDLRRSMRFYNGVLGATSLPGDGYGCPWYRLGTLVLTLLPNAIKRSPAILGTHAMAGLWLEVDDLEQAHRQFVAAGVEIIRPPDGLFMEVADPDGLRIEVWQADSD